MIDPADARARLHELIDMMPDEQVALVWMTFQSMFNEEYGDADDLDEDEASLLDPDRKA